MLIPQHLALGVIAVAAVLATGLTVYFWKKSTSLYSLLVEGANRFEELRARNTQLESAVLKSEERVKQGRDGAVRLEKSLSDAREKAAELVKRLETKEAEGTLVAEKLELQKSFLEKQLLKTQEQLRLSEEQRETAAAERDEAAKRYARAVADAEKAGAVARQEALLNERELVAKLRDMEKTVESAKKKVEAIDPAEIQKVRRKIAQYERLYNSMKGLREMTEERNKNYEVALKKLAVWILNETGGAGARLPDQMGPLVGRALEVIGAQLIDDNEAPAPRDARAPAGRKSESGARLADSMDDLLISDETEGALAALTIAMAIDAEAAALERERDRDEGPQGT